MYGAIPLISQYVFIAWCLVKHRDNFTFIFTFNGNDNFKKCVCAPSEQYDRINLWDFLLERNEDLAKLTEIGTTIT
jgi:hypothetical protein